MSGPVPYVVDTNATEKVREAKLALMADPERLADTVLICRDLLLEFDKRLAHLEILAGVRAP